MNIPQTLLFLLTTLISCCSFACTPELYAETDPLNGEREVVLEVAIQDAGTSFWAAPCFSLIAITTGPDPTQEMSHWEVKHYGGDIVTLNSIYFKKHGGAGYWHSNPELYKMAGIHPHLDANCYINMKQLKDGRCTLQHRRTEKYFGRGRSTDFNINVVVANKDKPDNTCYFKFKPIKTINLGEPEHWMTTDIRPLVILSEPPKHVDYTKNSDGEKTELNLSRKAGFLATFKDSEKSEISSSNTNTSDKNFGVKVSAETKADKGIPVVGGIKADISSSTEYCYNKHKEEIEKRYTSTSTQEQLKATNDDFLVFNKSTVHVWCYPIVGETDVETEDGDKGQLYYQIVVPDQDNDNPHYLAGRVAEWYQPVHQNGNVFSYPWSREQIAAFEQVDKLGMMSKPKTIATDGNDLNYYVEWDQATEEGQNISTSHKLATDNSIGVSFSVKGVGIKSSVKTHYDQTWKTLNTSTSKLSKSRGITISKCPLPESTSYAYEVHPLIYTPKQETKSKSEVEFSGAVKLSHLVKFPDDYSSYHWWKSRYGAKPDIALNLPNQWRMIDTSGNNWQFAPKAMNFQYMKGLFAEDEKGRRVYYSAEDGEKVTIKARVYNYSFASSEGFEVLLEAQESTDGEAWGKRFPVGKCQMKGLRGFGNTDLIPNWDYASFTFDTRSKGGKYYRFWVTANPDNKIAEIEDHGIGESYSNNEGFFPIAFSVKSKGTAENTGELTIQPSAQTRNATLHQNTDKLSLWVHSTEDTQFPVSVFFYEKAANAIGEGTFIDMETIPFIAKGKSFYVEIPYDFSANKQGNTIYAVAETPDFQSQNSVPIAHFDEQ